MGMIPCLVGGTSALVLASTIGQEPVDKPKSPIVLVVGCAREGPKPNIWILSSAGERTESARPGILTHETAQLARRSLGHDTYELIGVADFVDADTSRTIGVRGEILARARVNATGMLRSGRKVAVKGLYVPATRSRINLTSVVDLGAGCPFE